MKNLILFLIFFMPSTCSWCIGHASSDENHIKYAIQLAKTFLTQQVAHQRYGFDCQSNNNAIPCPVPHTGKLIASYFIVDGFGRDPIPETVRDVFLKEIYTLKQGIAWGYTLNAPLDADDTGFALQTLYLLGTQPDRNSLKMFYKPTKRAYATFVSAGHAMPVIHAAAKNNLGIHPDVNANIFNLYRLTKDRQHINYDLITQFQAEAGHWHTYFYPSRYYVTYLNLEVLCDTHTKPKAIQRGLYFILSSQNKDGSWGKPGNAYDTALALNALFACQNSKNESSKKGVAYLLSQQKKAGDWSADNVIWQYIPKDDPPTAWAAYDDYHVMTTALSLKALKGYLLNLYPDVINTSTPDAVPQCHPTD